MTDLRTRTVHCSQMGDKTSTLTQYGYMRTSDETEAILQPASAGKASKYLTENHVYVITLVSQVTPSTPGDPLTLRRMR